jgi:hypothetical protein
VDNQLAFEEFDAIWDKIDKKIEHMNIKTSSKSKLALKVPKLIGDFL